MFTPSYEPKVRQLQQSCEKFGLDYELYEVPSVHSSLSRLGSGDLRYTKANFICSLLLRHQLPILYLDSDCQIRAYPSLLSKLVADGCDFAIYNWLADEYTDTFFPVVLQTPEGENLDAGRLFQFSHSVDYIDPKQLICSGCTHFYNPTPTARALLKSWQTLKQKYPRVAEDECLDFVFNNPTAEIREIKAQWLPKSYARYATWIYAQPVIDHPEIPATSEGFEKLPKTGPLRRFYPERARQARPQLLLPRDCLIEVRTGLLYRISQAGGLVLVGSTDLDFWVS
ncbi:MAG: hypothetical protein ACAI44_19080 [Candidatus Sericytochromatia bacterium]